METCPASSWSPANPDAGSSLPFLIKLPLGENGLVLEARDSWPRTAKVYCHRADAWPADADAVEEVPVRSCVRRGWRSTWCSTAGSRTAPSSCSPGWPVAEAMFWQTARTARTTRPGVRMPGRRASGLDDLIITVDTRERYAFRFTAQPAGVERRPLPVGDHGVLDGDEVVAVVEPKSVPDLVKGLSDGA